MDEGYASRIFKKLIIQGLIIQVQELKDKRIYNLTLSDTGTALAQNINERSDQQIQKLLANFK